MVQLERTIAEHPTESLTLTAISLRNQYDELQREFVEEAERVETEVCTYRLFAFAHERYTMSAVATALLDFQRLFTVVYDALTTGPKRRAVIKQEVVERTEFSWAYTFPGSLGVVLTLPRERQMFASDPAFGATIDTVFSMAKARTPSDILEYTRRVGSAAVRQMDKWASGHADAGLGADIRWQHPSADKATLFIQVPEIQNLRSAISLSSDVEHREITVAARLVGADIDRKSFHLKTETKQDIHGNFSDAITDEHRAQIPADYMATLRVTTRTVYSSDEREDAYFLVALRPRETD